MFNVEKGGGGTFEMCRFSLETSNIENSPSNSISIDVLCKNFPQNNTNNVVMQEKRYLNK